MWPKLVSCASFFLSLARSLGRSRSDPVAAECTAMAESKREHLQVPLPCNLVAVLPAVDLESLSQSTLSRSIRIALSPSVLLQQRQHTQQRAARESRESPLSSPRSRSSPRASQSHSIALSPPPPLSLSLSACVRVCIRCVSVFVRSSVVFSSVPSLCSSVRARRASETLRWQHWCNREIQ